MAWVYQGRYGQGVEEQDGADGVDDGEQPLLGPVCAVVYGGQECDPPVGHGELARAVHQRFEAESAEVAGQAGGGLGELVFDG